MEDSVISTKEKAGEIDGFATAKPGEPIFTLQGGDPLAPETVHYWAGLARAAGLRCEKEEDAVRLFKRATSAEMVAWAMAAYQRGEAFQQQEQPKEKVKEVAVSADENSTRVRAATRLYNAIAELTEVVSVLDKVPEADIGLAAGDLQTAIILIRAATKSVDPREIMKREAQ